MELGESGKVSFLKISYLRKSSYLSDLRGIAIQAKQSFFNPLNSFLRKKIQLIFQRLIFILKSSHIAHFLYPGPPIPIWNKISNKNESGELPNLTPLFHN